MRFLILCVIVAITIILVKKYKKNKREKAQRLIELEALEKEKEKEKEINRLKNQYNNYSELNKMFDKISEDCLYKIQLCQEELVRAKKYTYKGTIDISTIEERINCTNFFHELYYFNNFGIIPFNSNEKIKTQAISEMLAERLRNRLNDISNITAIMHKKRFEEDKYEIVFTISVTPQGVKL